MRVVNSSNIMGVGYDETDGTLEVDFVSGGKYRYSGVEEEVYRGLMSADSVGGFFHDNIENGGYSYARVG